jgi:AcrR family transcriptional regulator
MTTPLANSVNQLTREPGDLLTLFTLMATGGRAVQSAHADYPQDGWLRSACRHSSDLAGAAVPKTIESKDPNKKEGGLREALVKEGRLIFEENGAKELSLREVARRVGVSEAAPFKHFEGKEGLLAAIAASGFRELAAQRKKIAAANLDSFGRAYQMMMSYVQFARKNEGLFDMMISPRLRKFREQGELSEAASESYGLFTNAIRTLAGEHGWPDEQLDLLSHAAWGLEHGIAALMLAEVIPREESELDLDSIIEFSVGLLLRAIQAGPGVAASLPSPLVYSVKRRRAPR